RRDTPPPAGIPGRQTYADIDRMSASPRFAVLYHAIPSIDLRGSFYQGFRVRNDVTVANEHLKPERFTGGEVGVAQWVGPFEARATAFWNEVENLIINVTRAVPLPDCPAGTTCRQ